jgi:hypothetical protein
MILQGRLNAAREEKYIILKYNFTSEILRTNDNLRENEFVVSISTTARI